MAWCKERAPRYCEASSTKLYLPANCTSGWCGLLHRTPTTTTPNTPPLVFGIIIIASIWVATVIVVVALVLVRMKHTPAQSTASSGGALRDPLLGDDISDDDFSEDALDTDPSLLKVVGRSTWVHRSFVAVGGQEYQVC